eukprot:284815576_5
MPSSKIPSAASRYDNTEPISSGAYCCPTLEMPTCLNKFAMPKVRASSATIGTMRGPSVASFSKLPSMRTKAMVVLISLFAAATANCANLSSGTATASACLRCGRPPKARRCCKYRISALSAAGFNQASASACSSLMGKLKRCLNASKSSSSFFWLCVVIRPCPALPMPPFLVCASITQGPCTRAAAAAILTGSWPPRLSSICSSLMPCTRRCNSGCPKKFWRLNAPSLAAKVCIPSTVTCKVCLSTSCSCANKPSQSEPQ